MHDLFFEDIIEDHSSKSKSKNKNDEWFTPEFVVDKVKKMLGHIDLDPASCKTANDLYINARKIYTKHDNGLDNPWNGKVFLNPPYSAKLIKQFIDKAVTEYESGNAEEILILTNSSTDSIWNSKLSKYLQAYTFRRLSFIDGATLKADGGTGRGQVITYLGTDYKKFIKIFTEDSTFWIPNLTLIGDNNVNE